jgi:energy-coupling factor transporter ATP-binding protein EcfA2
MHRKAAPMIDSLTFKHTDSGMMPWVTELDYFKRTPTTLFKPGLNVLFGGNGSGKSTLLQLLATQLAAAQGGTSVVTTSWLQDMFGFGNKGPAQLPCDVVHDGQPVMFFDARAKEGLIGGSFDDDFFNLGFANTMARGSTGQLGLQRMDRMLKVLNSRDEPAPPAPPAESQAPKPRGRSLKDLARPGGARDLVPQGFPTKIEWRVSREALSKYQPERVAAVDVLLAAGRPVGPKTLIFDEPESGFSMPWQVGLWHNVFSKVDSSRFQVIVATHSPFAIGIPGANYIEMEPGYLRQCLTAAQRFVDRLVPGQKDIA